jgi:hypothetical protein
MTKKIFTFAVPAVALVSALACSSSTTGTNPQTDASTAGVVAGPADTHCTSTVKVDPATCNVVPDASADTDGGMDMGVSDYGETLYNSEGDDDDCKYHVKWSAASVAEKADVTFTVVATNKSDGTPLTGAPVRAEVYLNDTHPAPNTNQKSTETSPGTYTVGPIQFDAAGQWTVRFHFNEECNDSPESPHGHAAFYVQVP